MRLFPIYLLYSILGLSALQGQTEIHYASDVFTELAGDIRAGGYSPFTSGFVENRNQWPDEVSFRMKTGGAVVWVRSGGITYDLYSVSSIGSEYENKHHFTERPAIAHDRRKGGVATQNEFQISGSVVQMDFFGANKAQIISGVERRSELVSFFKGPNADRWGVNCRSFERVQIENLYPGIDAILSHDQRLPRYDFVVAPGANPDRIGLALRGADAMRVGPNGELQIVSGENSISMQGLRAYQKIKPGLRRYIACQFVIDGNGIVRFKIGEYNKDIPLVIDPIIYSTLIGAPGWSSTTDIAYDSAGGVWITGAAFSFDTINYFPTVSGAYSRVSHGWEDVFISHFAFDPELGTQLTYSTLIGGNGRDRAYALALDEEGRPWVTGFANASDEPYPSTPDAYRSQPQGKRDVILTAIDPERDGVEQLMYSTFIGKSADEIGYDLIVNDGVAWITGEAFDDGLGESEFPLTAQALLSENEGNEGPHAFLCGSSLIRVGKA